MVACSCFKIFQELSLTWQLRLPQQQFAPSSLHRRLPLPLSHFDTIVATVVVTIGETGRVATIVQLMLVSVAIAVILRRFRTSGKISRSTDVVLVG